VREQLTAELGRSPSAAELAVRLGCTIEEIIEASEAAQARSSDSFDRPVHVRGESGTTLAEHLGDDDGGYAAAEDSATIESLLRTLPERDRLVLQLRFRDDLTQSEIGRRLGCSQMHVSRILRSAIQQLAAHAAHEPPRPSRRAGSPPVTDQCSSALSAISSAPTTATDTAWRSAAPTPAPASRPAQNP